MTDMIILVLHTEESSSFSSFPFIYTYFSDNKKHSSEYYKYIYLVTQSDYLYKVVLGLLIQYPCEKKHHLEYGNTVFVTVFFLIFTVSIKTRFSRITQVSPFILSTFCSLIMG